MHVHIECAGGEAKFWIEPLVALATHCKLKPKQLNEIQKIIERRKDEIIKEWKKHFSKH